jgi:murein L,D-transpeptidase YafK
MKRGKSELVINQFGKENRKICEEGHAEEVPSLHRPVFLPYRPRFTPWKGILPSRASVVIIKAKRKLFFYLDEQFVKTYPVVFGKNGNKQKLYEGDKCTPEGIFRVVLKRFHEEWSRFILLNYPTWDDVKRHEEACAKGVIPLRDGRCIGSGGGIGIHGTHSEILNRFKVDWTDGCISLFNRDIEEFFPYLKSGDLVFIFP